MQTKIEPRLIPKRKSHAFGKDVYLLGINKAGEYVWLESAKWDCNWYWGFGYIETYTNNKYPERARDISSHSHWDTSIIGKHEYYDHEKGCFRNSNDYIHHLNDNPDIEQTVLTDAESWTLAELMKTFYVLRTTAELYNRGGAGVTENPLIDTFKKPEAERHINEVLLPAVFAEVYKILEPK